MTATTTHGVKCGNCQHYHPSAAAVRYCYTGQGESVVMEDPQPARSRGDDVIRVTAFPPATEKQVNYVERLCNDKGMNFNRTEIAKLTRKEISGLIDELKDMPNKAQAAGDRAEVVKVKHGEQLGTSGLQRGGIHVVDGRYYRVHQSQRSGNVYACVWNGEGFDYEGGAIKRLTPANKATAEQAAAFGAMTERCCFCAKEIDTPESTAVGYGPICAGKFGLPWGDTTTGPVAV